MLCPRCKKADSYQIKFNCKFGKEKFLLDARVCRVCEFIWSDEKRYMDLVRKHLSYITKQNDSKPK